MSEKNNPNTTVILHWVIAASVFFLYISSWWMLALPLPSDAFTYRVLPFQLHKNIGLSILIFAVVMAALQIKNNGSNDLEARSRFQKLLNFDHAVIYFLVAACCITGYLSSSYSGWGTSFWWIADLPDWAAENDDLNIFFSDLHMWSCWALLAVITLHVGATIYHAFNDDGLINNMFRLK